ncbi:hypothetical protein ILUMI_08777 [Ignelater luminosus]|uniref:Uncharacterized protein n=1 Tax=Ignelater luminosus TaxID=2038154 RepID=A0A8K0D5L7_IGNLU|nr:hypothetical protein ILUMI_08777 [Ignelater luminosus]
MEICVGKQPEGPFQVDNSPASVVKRLCPKQPQWEFLSKTLGKRVGYILPDETCNTEFAVFANFTDKKLFKAPFEREYPCSRGK